MDNTKLYEYAVWSMKSALKKAIDNGKGAINAKTNDSLFHLGNKNYRLVTYVERLFQNAFLLSCKNLLKELMIHNEINFVEPTENEFVDFMMDRNEKKIGYKIVLSQSFVVDVQSLRKDGLDEMVFIVLEESIKDTYEVYEPNSFLYRKNGKDYVRNVCLKEFFEIFGSNEYSVFKKYIEEFNLDAEMMIGVNTTVIPSEESLQQCRENIKSIVTVQNPLGELINFCTKQRIFKTCFAILFR